MRENKLSIEVRKPVNEVFEFSINPINTPRWIKNIEVEVTSEWPIRLGTIYRNRNKNGKWTEYIVSALEWNKVFELRAKDNNYHVRYTYTKLGDGATGMEYFEWVDHGRLEEPFSSKVLEKLKDVVEGS
jgi:hypothetical protein